MAVVPEVEPIEPEAAPTLQPRRRRFSWGSLFVAALNTPGLVRLTTEGDRVTGEERLLTGKWRIRHVAVGPDGRPCEERNRPGVNP